MKAQCMVAVLLATFAAHVACGSKPRAIKTPQRPAEDLSEDLVVLLPDTDGTLGGATVSNTLGTTDLGTARASARVSNAQPPSPAGTLSDIEVQQLFGDVLSALPSPPRRFTLYFRFESEELTLESRARVPEILQAVRSHPAPDVAVVGHTDTTGVATRNLQLGLSRAKTVRDILIAAKLDGFAIEVSSHGEADPLVRTADEVFEPRNRRVEITVR